MLGYLTIILLTYNKLPEELPLKSNKQWSKLWDYFLYSTYLIILT